MLLRGGPFTVCWCDAPPCDDPSDFVVAGTLTPRGPDRIVADPGPYLQTDFDLSIFGTGLSGTDRIRIISGTRGATASVLRSAGFRIDLIQFVQLVDSDQCEGYPAMDECFLSTYLFAMS